MKTELTADTYSGRCDEQIVEWQKGNSIHNKVDDECCPDFSCCNPQLLKDNDFRDRLTSAHLSGDRDTVDAMLMSCLGNLFDNAEMRNVNLIG